MSTGQSGVAHTFTGGTATRTITAALTNGLPNPIDNSFGTGGKSVVVNTGVDDKAFDIAVQPDGKLLVAGGPGLSVARYNTDGSVDTSFGTNGRATASGAGTAFGMVLQADGKILIGGGTNFGMARFTADGQLDTTFGTNGVASSGFGTTYAGYDLAIVDGGKIVEVGTNGGTNFIVARFNANGSVDTSFGTAGKTATDFFGSLDKAFALAVQSDGKLLLAGQARDGATNYKWAMARYNANGSLDTTFGTGGKGHDRPGQQRRHDLGRSSSNPTGRSSRPGWAGRRRRATTSRWRGTRRMARSTRHSVPAGIATLDFGSGGDQAFALELLPGDKFLLAGRAQSSSNAMNFGLARFKQQRHARHVVRQCREGQHRLRGQHRRVGSKRFAT